MIANLKHHLNNGEEGFTLIELLVVVLILGILMAIAIPTFLSLTGGAKTSAAEADLTTAAQDEAAYLTTNGTFDPASTVAATATTDNIAAMQAADSGINWAASPGTAGTKSVAVQVVSNTPASTLLYLESLASDGNYYWVRSTGGTLAYAETSVILSAATPPASADWASSWKALPSASPEAT